MIQNIAKRMLVVFTLGVGLALGLPGLISPAFAAGGDLHPDNPAGIIILILLIALAGIAIGSLGLLVNHIFYRRTVISYILLKRKPGLSLLMGIIITLVGFGLIAILNGVEQLQLLILLLYVLGLGLFAVGVVSRLVASIVEPQPVEDELPGTWAFLKGGLILTSVNIVVLLGNIFFIGLLMAGVGATLLGFFAGMGNAIAGDVEKPPVERQVTPPE